MGSTTEDSGFSEGPAMALASLCGRSRALWTAGLVCFVGGDLLTTFVGLQIDSVVEGGPIPALALALHGFELLVVLKLGAVVLLVVVWLVAPEPSAVGVPIGLLVVGVLATTWNVMVICVAVL